MSNFIINGNNHDFMSNIAKTVNRIGDVGEESTKYKDAAFQGLSTEEVQDDYMEENRLQRMQYGGEPIRQDEFDNSAEAIKKQVDAKQIVKTSVDSIRDAFKNPDFTLDTTETIVSDEIIKK
jgi:hypothetical protein